jgi:hypothetical protein
MPQHATKRPLQPGAVLGTVRHDMSLSATRPKKQRLIRVRVDESLHARLAAMSADQYLDLSAYVRQVLGKHAATPSPRRR